VWQRAAKPLSKGNGSTGGYFLKRPLKMKSVFSVHAQMVVHFKPASRKRNIKYLLVSLKTLTNSNDFFQKSHQISAPAYLLCHWSIFSQCTFLVGFRNFILNVLHKKTVKNCGNHQRSYKGAAT
jgi:hypothetical protein